MHFSQSVEEWDDEKQREVAAANAQRVGFTNGTSFPEDGKVNRVQTGYHPALNPPHAHFTDSQAAGHDSGQVDRKQTAFVRPVDLPDSSGAEYVHFSGTTDMHENSKVPRVQTGWHKPLVEEERHARFEGSANSVAHTDGHVVRHPTGFVRQMTDDSNVDESSSLRPRFDTDEVVGHEGGPMQRVQTGFVRKDQLPREASGSPRAHF